jgi:hypothetical protein
MGSKVWLALGLIKVDYAIAKSAPNKISALLFYYTTMML